MQSLRIELYDQRKRLLSLRRPEGARHVRKYLLGPKGAAGGGDLSIFQHSLLTDEHAELFAEEYAREALAGAATILMRTRMPAFRWCVRRSTIWPPTCCKAC